MHVILMGILNDFQSIDVDAINARLDKKWAEGRYTPMEGVEEYSSDWLLNQIIEDSTFISNYWDAPPQITKRPDSPHAYGVYLRGPDKISRSNGEDPDDLNSWDHTSRMFHYQKRYRREQRTKHGTTAILTLSVLVIRRVIMKTIPRTKIT